MKVRLKSARQCQQLIHQCTGQPFLTSIIGMEPVGIGVSEIAQALRMQGEESGRGILVDDGHRPDTARLAH